MLRIALAIAVLSACSGEPYGPDYTGVEVNAGLVVKHQDHAMARFERMAEEFYQTEFDDLWRDATVFWTDTVCQDEDSGYFGQHAVLFRGCWGGRAWDCSLYVARSNGPKDRICGSSLVHEYAHCLRGDHTGCNDSDHSDKDFWAMVGKTNDIACANGW